MNDRSKETADENPDGETPAQRALRLRKAALEARPHPTGGNPFPGKQVAGMKAGLSKPQMRK